MKPAAHLAASAAVSAALYCSTKSLPVTGASFLCGFLIDIDHLLDYIREYGFRSDIRHFFRIFHETRFVKLYLIFHAWEWVAGLLLLAWTLGWNGWILGTCIGIFQHLLLDQLDNGVTPWGYSFVYRARRRFAMQEIVQEAVVRKKRGEGNL